MGRLQGRGPQGQGPPHDEQRSGGRPEALRRQDAPLVRALGLQVRDGRRRRARPGAIIIHTTPSAGYGWQVIQTSWAGEKFELPDEGVAARRRSRGGRPTRRRRRSRRSAARTSTGSARAAEKRDFRPVPLGVTALASRSTNTIRQRRERQRHRQDPRAATRSSREQVVLYTAHHDHFGIKDEGAKPGDDAIYNGALDNASGVAAILAVARAFTRLPKPPRRTIVLRVRDGGGAGPARLRVPREAPARARRARSPRTSTSTRSTSGGRRATSR